MDEEKFRKAGKKKFEHITERLVAAAKLAQQYCLQSAPLDTSGLSAQSQLALHGKLQERAELMHLHTLTHGTRRWSGDGKALVVGDSFEDSQKNIENRPVAVVTNGGNSTPGGEINPKLKTPSVSNVSRHQNRPNKGLVAKPVLTSATK